MKKRIWTVLLALALCVGLTLPAFAVDKLPGDYAEAFQNVSLSYTLGGGHKGSFDSSIIVKRAWTLLEYDFTDEGDVVEELRTMSNYGAVRGDTVFTVSCSGPADACFVRVYLRMYVNRGDGRYEWIDWPHSMYLTHEGGFVGDIIDPEYYGGLVELKGGQSIQFTLPEFSDWGEYDYETGEHEQIPRNDVIYEIEVQKWYPDFSYEEEDGYGGTQTVTPYFYQHAYFKVDEAAVDNDLSKIYFSDVRMGQYYADAVAWAVEKNITTGKTETTFAPNENCTHGQILTFLWRAAGSPASNAATPFAMKGNEYYYGAAKWAFEKGMIDADFGPGANCTRADAVRYIWQAFGSPAAGYDGRFADVAANSPYAQAVAWAVEQGITTGATAGTFNPGGVCNRGQIVTFLYRAYK